MRSPFPGMDPYLEDPALWLDFHATFLNYWREAIADRLPDTYEARLDEKVRLVERLSLQSKLVYPDIGVTLGEGARPRRTSSGGGGLTLEPVTAPLPQPVFEQITEREIRILRRPERSLVAILELLSPANKNEDYAEYMAKRRAILQQSVHLVELDLLIGGDRPALGIDWPAGEYTYLVARVEDRPNCQVFSWDMRDPLPCLPVPLKKPDADLAIDLAAVFNTTYERGRYAKSLAYGAPPPVPLGPEKLQWATSTATPTGSMPP